MSIYDKASLVLIPSGTKTSKVYSQKPTNGDGDFTFSRSTAATRVNASGNIEKETQNLLTYSNTFSDASWGNVRSSVTSGITDPFGGSNAWSFLTDNTADAQHYMYKLISQSGVGTLSIYAKANGYNWLRMRLPSEEAYFDLANGVTGSSTSGISASMTDAGGGWYRCEVAISDMSSSTTIFMHIAEGDGDIHINGTPSGSDGLYIYAAQLEQGLVARDYIETTTTAIYGGITDNVPRLDYTDSSCPALLLEPQRTNLLTNSEYFSDSTNWSSSTNNFIENNSTISPEGLQNATKLYTTSGFQLNRYDAFPSVTIGVTYTFSAYFKKDTSNEIDIYIYSVAQSGFGSRGRINFDAGTITNIEGTSADIQDAGNGWYRASISFVGDGTLSYGFISPTATTSSVFVYGAQAEAGSYATSYIPTYGSAVTRNMDMAEIIPISSSIIDTSLAHSGFIEIQSNGVDLSYQIFGIDDGSYNNFIKILQNSSQTNHRLYSRSGGGSYLTSSYGSSGQYNKYAWTYDGAGTLKYFLNGSLDSTHSVTFPTMSNVGYGERSGDTNYAAHSTNQILLFPTALTDQEAIDLTTI